MTPATVCLKRRSSPRRCRLRCTKPHLRLGPLSMPQRPIPVSLSFVLLSAFPPSTTFPYTGFNYASSSSASSPALYPCWSIAASSPEGFFPYRYYYATSSSSPSHAPASFLDTLVTLNEERHLYELSQGCHTGPAELFPWLDHLQAVPHVTTAPSPPPPASLAPPRLHDPPCPTPKKPNQP